MFTKEQIQIGLDEAYKLAGNNAYFDNGFSAGIKFAQNKTFEQQLTEFNAFLSLVGKTIGYGSELDYPINDSYIDSKWQVTGGYLSIGGDEEIYFFNISSYSAKGEKLFYGKIGGYFLVMAYQDRRDFAEVFILRNKNRIKDE